MKTRLTHAERRAETRQSLLDAAEELFTERGFHATSLDAVAQAAGYTKGAVYSQFANKDDLFLAVYERRIAARSEEVVAGTAAMSWEVAIRTVMDRYLELLRTRPLWRALVIEFAVHAVREPELRERYAAAHRATNTRLAESLPPIPSELDREDLLAEIAVIASGLSLETLIDPESIPDGLPGRLALRSVREEKG